MLLDLLQQGLPGSMHGNFAPAFTSLQEELSFTEILTSCLPDTSSSLSLLHILHEGLPDNIADVANVDTTNMHTHHSSDTQISPLNYSTSLHTHIPQKDHNNLELYVPPLCHQGSCKDQLAEIYANVTCATRSDNSGANTLAWPPQSPYNQRGNEASKPSTSSATSDPSSTLEYMDVGEFAVQDWHRQSSHREIKDADTQHSCQTSLDEGNSYMQESLPFCVSINMGPEDACRNSSHACGAVDKNCFLDNCHTRIDVRERVGTDDDCAIAVSRPAAARKRKRSRIMTCKNTEEVESQRMTHIAVERNRRKQMNEHLSVLRSLMPSPYIQRGDQASIIGGAIDFVKELEHVLQALKAQRKQRHCKDLGSSYRKQESSVFEETKQVSYQMQHGTECSSSTNISSEKFTHVACEGVDVDVMLIGSFALVKVLAQKLPHQLWKTALSIESFHMKIMQLNVTTIDKSVLYSFNLELLGDSQFQSANGIAQLVQNIFRTQK